MPRAFDRRQMPIDRDPLNQLIPDFGGQGALGDFNLADIMRNALIAFIEELLKECSNVFLDGLKALGVGTTQLEMLGSGLQNFVDGVLRFLLCDPENPAGATPQDVLEFLYGVLTDIGQNPFVAGLIDLGESFGAVGNAGVVKAFKGGLGVLESVCSLLGAGTLPSGGSASNWAATPQDIIDTIHTITDTLYNNPLIAGLRNNVADPAGNFLLDTLRGLTEILDALAALIGGNNTTPQDILEFFQNAVNTLWGVLNLNPAATGKTVDDLIDSLTVFFGGAATVSGIVEAVTGVADGTIEKLKEWADNVPDIPSLVAALTGAGTDDLPTLDLPSLQTWAQSLLTQQTPIPADNLFGQITGAAIGSLPVAHINTTNPNLLSQGSFNASSTIAAGDGWEWDGAVNRTSGGGGSAKVTCNGTLRRLYSTQAIPVVGGDRIELSAYIKTSGFVGAADSINVAIIPFIGSQPQAPIVAGASNSAVLTQAASASDPASWPEIGTSAPIIMDAGVTSIKVRLAVTSAATSGAVWFDSIRCNKAGLLGQGLVENLTDAWDLLWKGAQGLPIDEFIPVPKTSFDIYEALSNPTSLVQTVTTNFGVLETILNTDPGQILGTVGVNGGDPLGLGSALLDGTVTFDEFVSVLGKATAGAAANLGAALDGVRQNVENLFTGILDLFGVSTTAKNNSITNADNISETNRAIYSGYTGVGGSGAIAETQEVVRSIRTRLDAGYTLSTLTNSTGSQLQVIAVIGSPTGGTFTLDYGPSRTSSIAYNASAATVQAALETFGNIGTGNVTVTQRTVDANRYDYVITLAPFTQGIAITGSPTGGTWTLTYKGQTTTALARNATTTQVRTALEALPNIGSGKVIVTGTAGSIYYVQFSPTVNGVQLLTATKSFTGGIAPAIVVADVTEYGQFKFNSALTGGTNPGGVPIMHWKRPWTADNAPKEFFAICIGSSAGAGAGTQRTSNNADEYGTSNGGAGSAPGGYVAVELDAALLPEWTYYSVAPGGFGQTKFAAATPGSESNFGGLAVSQAGQYFVRNLLGYYTTNQSAPGAGGAGGAGNTPGGRGVDGVDGGSSQLAVGGSRGSGSYSVFFSQLGLGTAFASVNTVTNGVIGATPPLDGKARAGGGGGGGGGGAWSWRAAGGSYALPGGNFTATPPYSGGLGGNGGFPGGGAGGGGGAFTFDSSGGSAPGIEPGNGGNGAHGIIILLWR